MVHVTLLRHAESMFNTGVSNVEDVNLTFKGAKQAQKLTGQYDLVICSPLRRAVDTLFYSKIKYRELILDHDVREVKKDICDFLLFEPKKIETEKQVLKRVERFKKYLDSLEGEYQRILIVSHGDFIWYLTSKLVNGDGLTQPNDRANEVLRERYGTWLDNGEFMNCELYLD